MKNLSELNVADFVGIVLNGSEKADEAMYYLLHDRMNLQLKKKYIAYQHQLADDFDDVLDDFFLYLRDGKDGKNSVPYQSLRRIRNHEAFGAWMLRTFRNYLCVYATKERELSLSDIDTSSSILTDEQKLSVASHLIAYAHQVMPPRECFILLRTLLTMLNKKRSISNEKMSLALGMNYVTYRVIVHRLKNSLTKYRTRLLQGEPLELDAPHQQMEKQLNENFLNLYPALLPYYEQTFEALDNASVKRLREEYFNSAGNMLHEVEADYSIKPSMTTLWDWIATFLETH